MTVRAPCPNGSPSGLVWFNVRVVVSSDKSVNIFLDDAPVTSLTAYFQTKGRAGVVVSNGLQNIIRFKALNMTAN